MVTSSRSRSRRGKVNEDLSDPHTFRARSRSAAKTRSAAQSAVLESSDDDETERMSKTQRKDAVVKDASITGNGMTIWWLLLFVVTLTLRFEQAARQWALSLDHLPAPALNNVWSWILRTSPNSTDSAVRLLQGISTVSALCVGIGYYVFKICFRFIQGSMAWQLYTQMSDPKPIPFWGFYILDIFVHFCLVVLISYYWWKHVDSMAVILTWVYNRLWSYVHSKGECWYFCRVEEVYGFRKPMPWWSYVVLYLSESCIVGFALYTANQRYNSA